MAGIKGLKYIALTDHNTFEGLDETIKTGEVYGVNVIPGIEIDSIFWEQNLHIIGYYLKWENSELREFSDNIKNEQLRIVKMTIEKLNTLGLKVSYNQVLHYSNRYSIPGYASIAEAILKNKDNYQHHLLKQFLDMGNRNENPIYYLMRDLMYPGKPAYIEIKKYPTTKDVIELILKFNGVPILAHPGLYFSPEREDDIKKIKILKEYGLKGIESISSYHNEKINKKFQKLSKKLNMIITAGSDFHGRLKPNIEMGRKIPNFLEMINQLKSATSN